MAVKEVCIEEGERGQDYTIMAMGAHTAGGVETKIYDSGASRHMMPFRNCFTSYRSIPPRAIKAADGRVFFAIGEGDLKVEVPNDKSTTPVLLRDTLHAPDMGLTIVSISRITGAGHTVSFEGKSYKMKNKAGVLIGKIPANASGLYKVEHAYTAVEPLEKVDLPMLHRRLGYVADNTLRSLICNHLIDGIDLIDDGSPLVCDSCEHAKFTCKPI